MNDKKSIVLLILFSAALFFIGIYRMPLTDPDETFYAETAREMMNRGEWLTPYIFGKPQFEKPPLYYWLVIFGFKAFGVSESSARVASAVFGVIGVIGVYFLGKILLNRRCGFLSGVILATSVIYTVLSRACVTDIVLTVFILYAFLFFFYKRYLLSAVMLVLAVLTKGPIGLFLPFAIIGAYLLFAKELKKLKEIPFIRGALLFLAVALPWYFLMYKAHGKEFINVFFGFHNVMRFLEPEHKIGDVFYYYAPVALGGFFPWSVFLPLGIWQAFREKEGSIKKTNIFLALWILVIFLFFSFSRTKLPTYIFPLYPALALLVSRFLDVSINKDLTKKMKIAMVSFSGLFFVILFGGLIALYFILKMKYPSAVAMSLIAGTAFIFLMILTFGAFLKERYKASLIIFMASFVIFISFLSFFVLPELGKYESSKEISKELLAFAKPGERLGAETDYQRGIAFYTNREDILDVHPHNVITIFLSSDERVWCVIKEKNHRELYTDKKQPFTKPTYVVYKLGKRVIVTNKMPEDGKFLKMRSLGEPN